MAYNCEIQYGVCWRADLKATVTQNNDGLAELLSWAGILVPIVLVFVTALIRSIVKRNNFFSGENLYLGIDLSFAGLAAGLVEITELLRQHVENPDDTQFSKIVIAFLVAFVNGICLLVVTKLHQRWEADSPTTKVIGVVLAERDQNKLQRNHRLKRFLWLGLASNGVGFGTIIAFAYLRARKIV